MKFNVKLFCAILISTVLYSASLYAEDSAVSRGSLAGLNGVYILVENIQPNIQKYAQKAGISTVQIQRDVEGRLNAARIRTLSRAEWLKAPGRPILYININTHETEKYWYAYDIKLELRQLVHLEVNPKIKTLADTWSINITGVANIGNLHLIKKDAAVLLEQFIQAYKAVNRAR